MTERTWPSAAAAAVGAVVLPDPAVYTYLSLSRPAGSVAIGTLKVAASAAV